MSGVDNWRAFGPGAAALGLAVDAAWRRGPTFVQIEAGAAIVSDKGPQIDDVFGAIGVGKQINPRVSLLAEWRVEMFPTRERMHGPAIGFGRRDADARSWRLRFHPYVFDSFEWGGVAVALDFIQRFP
ncbi:MAG: hypothetical protein H0T42_11320 [Deltaproteobacteria bacterium]|nr:hypothetical protein [Deltaproteobacteria bacterium]